MQSDDGSKSVLTHHLRPPMRRGNQESALDKVGYSGESRPGVMTWLDPDAGNENVILRPYDANLME